MRERSTLVPTRTRLGRIAAGCGVLVALGIAALWTAPEPDPTATRPTASSVPELPELQTPTLPERARARADGGVPADESLRLPRERKLRPLKEEATKPRLPERESLVPEIAPLPPVDAKPELAMRRPRAEGRIGPESLISPDIGEGTLLVLPTRKHQLAGLVEPARPGTAVEPETPSVSAAPASDPPPVLPEAAVRTAHHEPPSEAPAPIAKPEPRPAPKPVVTKPPGVAVGEPRPMPVAFAPPGLEHIDLGQADLLELLPELEPLGGPSDRPVLTFQPLNDVKHPPLDLPSWIDVPEIIVSTEPAPQLLALPMLSLLKPFRDQLRDARNRVLDTVTARHAPEPGTAALLSLGLVWLAVRRRA